MMRKWWDRIWPFGNAEKKEKKNGCFQIMMYGLYDFLPPGAEVLRDELIAEFLRRGHESVSFEFISVTRSTLSETRVDSNADLVILLLGSHSGRILVHSVEDAMWETLLESAWSSVGFDHTFIALLKINNLLSVDQLIWQMTQVFEKKGLADPAAAASRMYFCHTVTDHFDQLVVSKCVSQI